MDTADLQRALCSIGIGTTVDGDYGPQTRQHVAWLQEAWPWAVDGVLLIPDGIVGPLTEQVIATLQGNGGMLTMNFSLHEFRCGAAEGNSYTVADPFLGGGRRVCQWCLGEFVLTRKHLQNMQNLRNAVGPVKVVNGHRCHFRNAAIGGATASQHLTGAATDIDPGQLRLTVADVERFRLFGGIEVRADGLVYHVDSRPGANPLQPVVFTWA